MNMLRKMVLWVVGMTLLVMAGFGSVSFMTCLRFHSRAALGSSLVGVALVLAFICCFNKVAQISERYADRHPGFLSLLPFSLVILCFVLHESFNVLSSCFYNQEMIADFRQVQTCVESGKLCVAHLSRFSHWCHYELLMSACGMLFSPRLATGQLVNAICIAAIVYPVFKTVEQFAGVRYATLTSFLLIFYPTTYVYGTILTGEYLSAMFLIYGFYFCFQARRSQGWGWLVIYVFASGISLTLSQMFKPIVLILLLSWLLSLAVEWFACQDPWRVRVKWFVFFLVVSLIYVTSNRFILKILPDVHCANDKPVASQGVIPWSTLLTGLNVETGGAWSKEWNKIFFSLSREEAKQMCLERIKRDFHSYPKLFAKKFLFFYITDEWAPYTMAETVKVSELPEPIVALSRGWYIVLHLLTIWAIFKMLCGLLRKKQIPRPEIITALLVICGFSVAMMILEMQGRYRTSIYPFYFLILFCAFNSRELNEDATRP